MADLSITTTTGESDGAPSGQFADSSTAGPPANTTLLDLSVLVSYLRRVVPATMEPDGILLDSFRELLQQESTLERFRRFISDPQCKAISIQRQLIKGKSLAPMTNCRTSSDLTFRFL